MCFEKFGKWMQEKHKNPANCILHIIGAVIIICALWNHSIAWILIGILIMVVGHIIQAAGEKKPGKKVKKRKKRR